MKILHLVPRIPFPSDSGGTLRALQLLRALDDAFEVTVLAPELPGGDARGLRAGLRGRVVTARETGGAAGWALSETRGVLGGGPVGYARYAGRNLRAVLRHLLSEQAVDLVHFDHVHTAQLLPEVRKFAPRARTVMDAHNVEAQVAERLADVSRWPLGVLLRRQAAAITRLEARVVQGVDAVLSCSELDATAFRRAGAREVHLIPNGVEFRQLPAALEPRDTVAFVGSFDWRPNVDAAVVLAREIWPRMREACPGLRLALIGRKPPPLIRELDAEDIEVTGRVDDVAPWLLRSFATAMPLRAGSGTRLKVLEAAAARVPIVATRLASEGLPFEDGTHLLHAETPEAFVDALLRLRREPALGARLTDAAWQVAQAYDWRRIGARLVELYGSWSSGERARPRVLSSAG
ncbi:MAG TPA: glycosyltransferase family 4 protein [Myxococcaceae bacterium]|nr:glycosyltransferase family 4 protein [Myxococcaceae bacterium]